ncbi:MAG: translocation/assembly module TamB domain-containing protein [Chitinophagaceae bacterium]
MSKRKTIRKVIVGILLGIVALLVLVVILLQTQWAKNLIRAKAEAFLQKKLQTGVRIGKLDYSLPTWIEIGDIAVEDRAKDTLLSAARLRVDIDMLDLIFNNINIRHITLEHTLANLSRKPGDSTFNFQFIIDAFASDDTTTVAPKDTTALKMTLRRLTLKDIRFNYRDSFASMQFGAWINNLQTKIDIFQPDKMRYAINTFDADTVNFNMVSWGKPSAGTATAVDTTGYTPLLVSAGDFSLKHITVSYADSASKMYYANNVGALGLSKVDFDLSGMKAAAKEAVLNNSSIVFSSYTPATPVPAKGKTVQSPPPAPASPSWKVSVKQLTMANNSFKMDNTAAKPQPSGVDMNHMLLTGLKVNVQNIYYAGTDSITALVNQLAVRDKSGLQVDTTHLNLVLSKKKLSATALYLQTPRSVFREKAVLQFDSLAGITIRPERSLVTANLPNVKLAVSDLLLFAPQLKQQFTPAQQNGVVLINSQMNGSLAKLNIPLLQVSLPGGSRVSGRAVVYNVTDPDKLGYEFYASPLIVNMQDVAGFLPDSLKKQMASLPKQIYLNGLISGDMQNLQADATIKADSQLLSVKGSIQNMTDPKKLKYDLFFRKSYITRSFIYTFVPPDSLPIALPEWVSLHGKLKGDMNNVYPDLQITSAYGNANIKGYITNIQKPAQATYDLTASTQSLRLGTILKQDSVLGNVTGHVAISGKGLDTATLNAKIKASIDTIGLMGYDYRRIDLDATVDRKSAQYVFRTDDPNLRLNASGNVDLNSTYPVVQTIIQLDTARLMALGLYSDTLDLSTKASIDFKSLDPKRPDGELLITNLLMTKDRTKFYLDTIQGFAGYTDSNINFSLHAAIADLQASGQFDYTKIGPALQGMIKNYYQSSATDTLLTSDTTGTADPQRLNLTLKIYDHPLWQGLLPGLTRFQTITASAALDTYRDSGLNVKLDIPLLNYNGIVLTKSTFNANGNRQQLKYDFNAQRVHVDNTIIYAPAITGTLANNTADISVSLKDRRLKERHRFRAIAYLSDTAYSLSMPGELMLDYKTWTVHTPNLLRYANNTITARNFRFAYKKQLVSAETDFSKPNQPLQLSIDSFQLSTITSFFGKDTAFMEGNLNTDIEIADFSQGLPSFNGKASITNIAYNKKPIGDLNAEFKKADENTVTVNMAMTKQGNDATIKGSYYLNNTEKQLDVDIQLNHLNAAAIEPFSGGALSEVSGGLSGKLSITGTVQQPEWQGNLNFDTMLFKASALGTRYRIYNQKIGFQYPNITFNKFAVLDSQKHELVIDGTVKSNTLSSYGLDLAVKADRFTAVQAQRAANSMVYGYAEVSTNLNVKGTTDRPSIDGSVTVNDKTDLYYVMPQSNANADDARRIVRFVDMDTVDRAKISNVFADEGDSLNASSIDYNVDMRITKAAAITVIVDPSSGDALKVQGTASLNAGVDAAGNMALTGVYELESGYYELNKIVKKKFALRSGSTITFAGDPTQGVADITAVYTTMASPSNLIGSELSSTTGVSTGYNERIPFNVLLMLKGPLMHPEISFDVEMQANVAGVNSQLSTAIDSKLQQMKSDPTLMNKQVFSLLVLNRFVPEQSNDFFGGSGGLNAGTAAQQSVSQFLSEALNQATQNLIQGFDINMNVESYETSNSSNRTDLNVNISKGFLNDRLTISVGKNFVLEGSDPATQGNSNMQYIPDITGTYKLTRDGKYLLRGYRKNQYEAILDGYFVETGLAFTITMNYNRFKELFERPKRRRGRNRKTNETPPPVNTTSTTNNNTQN